MPFAYYDRLSPARKAIYRRSDGIAEVPLPQAEKLRPLISPIASTLTDESTVEVQQACQRLVDGLLRQLRVAPARVIVLDTRPSHTDGELHGLYEPGEASDRARITLWMRTARQERVVAFRSFLRTLLHELLHHLDYELFELPETLHTEGFFKRESSLFHQLVTEDGDPAQRR